MRRSIRNKATFYPSANIDFIVNFFSIAVFSWCCSTPFHLRRIRRGA